MGLVPWQATVTNETKTLVPNPVVTVYVGDTATLATLYSDKAGTPQVNPVTGDANGFVQFWANPGEYRIEGAKSGDLTDPWYWDAVELGVTQPYASRAAMIASDVPSSVSRVSHLTETGVLVEYVRDALAADIADFPGWEPEGSLTPFHFGGVGDGVADDRTAVDAASALGAVKLTADHAYPYAVTAPNGRFYGDGHLIVNGNKAARHRSSVLSEPTRSTSHTFIGTAFNGDLSRVQFPVEHYVLGAATIGQPATGYLYTPEASPHYTWLYNTAGHNQGTDTNVGRTGMPAYRTRVTHLGQGDGVAYNASVFVGSQKAGATHWLAQPAGVILNGEVLAGANYVYLNVVELGMHDQGYDASAVGAVFKGTRSVARSGQETYWAGVRVQSLGSEAFDDGYVVKGKVRIGLNLSRQESANQAAIAMAANQRVYWNASATPGSDFDTTLGNSYTTYTGSFLTTRLNDHNVLSLPNVASGIATLDARFTATGNVNSGAKYQVGYVDVVGPRRTGWTPATGAATRTAYDTATVTTVQLAQRVKALIDDLIAHGLIGA